MGQPKRIPVSCSIDSSSVSVSNEFNSARATGVDVNDLRSVAGRAFRVNVRAAERNMMLYRVVWKEEEQVVEVGVKDGDGEKGMVVKEWEGETATTEAIRLGSGWILHVFTGTCPINQPNPEHCKGIH